MQYITLPLSLSHSIASVLEWLEMGVRSLVSHHATLLLYEFACQLPECTHERTPRRCSLT